MRKAGASNILLLGLCGCSLAAPLYDRQMADAEHQACAAVNTPPAEGAAQCFTLFEEDDAGRRAWSGGALAPGRTLLAVHTPAAAPSCAARHTHLTVTGSTPAAGRLELAAWDGMGRPGHARVATWGAPFARRTLALASIDNVVMMPAGVRVRVLDGSFDPASLCFKGY